MDNIKRQADSCDDLQDQVDFKRLKTENGLDTLASASTADTMAPKPNALLLSRLVRTDWSRIARLLESHVEGRS
jgi:hypothetical protein